jgi:hypothetical protein
MRAIRNFLGRFHGRCDHAMRRASDRIDGRLGIVGRVMLWFHLTTCLACHRAAGQLRDLRSMQSDTMSTPVPPLSGEARERIGRALRESQKADPGTDRVADAGEK